MGKPKKLYMAFDEEKRREYLTGFRKRKQMRREKARKENESKLKEEIKNVKNAYHSEFMEKLKKVALPNFLYDDFDVVSKRTTTDTGGHHVSVEEININQSHYFMGIKGVADEAETALQATSSLISLKKALKMNPQKHSWRRRKKKVPHGPCEGRRILKLPKRTNRKK